MDVCLRLAALETYEYEHYETIDALAFTTPILSPFYHIVFYEYFSASSSF